MAKKTKLQKFAAEKLEVVKYRWKKSPMDYAVVKNDKDYKLVNCTDWLYVPDTFVTYLDEVKI